MQDFDFTMWIGVHNPDQLRVAAIARAAAEGARDNSFLDAEGGVDIAACLVMLLDPGSLPGCHINESGAAEAP